MGACGELNTADEFVGAMVCIVVVQHVLLASVSENRKSNSFFNLNDKT